MILGYSAPGIQREVLDRCGVRTRVVLTDRLADEDRLSEGEAGFLSGIPEGPRRVSWLLGRNALKNLLLLLGRDSDTSKLAFPHPTLSLSHSEDVAVAIGTDQELAGVGVDLELSGPPPKDSGHLFLCEAERGWIASLPDPDREEEMLRLWTIKEAAFKATPENKGIGMPDYEIAEPVSTHGIVRLSGRDPDLRILYCMLKGEQGLLSVAVSSRDS